MRARTHAVVISAAVAALLSSAGAAPWAHAGARAQPPAVTRLALLTDARIGPYRDTARGMRRQGPAIPEFDVRSSSAIAALRAQRPTVVLAIGQQALQVATRELRDTPIVFANVLAPQQYSLPETVSGVPLEADPAHAFQTLRRVLPRLRKVGVVSNPATFAGLVADQRRAAAGLGIEIAEVRVNGVREVQPAVRRLLRETDALYLLPDPSLWSRETLSFTLLEGIQQGRPVIGFLDAITQSGAFASFAPDYGAIGRRARETADAIAADPRNGARRPRIVYASGRLSVNMATAGRLRITLPAGLERQARIFR